MLKITSSVVNPIVKCMWQLLPPWSLLLLLGPLVLLLLRKNSTLSNEHHRSTRELLFQLSNDAALRSKTMDINMYTHTIHSENFVVRNFLLSSQLKYNCEHYMCK